MKSFPRTSHSTREIQGSPRFVQELSPAAPVLVRSYFVPTGWILYLSCTDPVLILYWKGCFWLDFQGVYKIVFKVPFPHSGRLLRKFLPPQCSTRQGMVGLQIVYRGALRACFRVSSKKT
jgi:hypothetical protein